MKLLMHICCAPCANMPIDALRADGIDLTGYWYNPNIHPFTEYRARRNCLQEYAKTIRPAAARARRLWPAAVCPRCSGRHCGPLRQVLRDAPFRGGTDGEGGRLRRVSRPRSSSALSAARADARRGLPRGRGNTAVQFYYQDFRPMFRDGQTRARELGFYIQKYCGCVFSEQERYQKPSRIIP